LGVPRRAVVPTQAGVNHVVRDDGQDGKPDTHEEDAGHVHVPEEVGCAERRPIQRVVPERFRELYKVVFEGAGPFHHVRITGTAPTLT